MNSVAPRRNLWPLWAVLAVTLAPVLASYLMYYGVKPEGRVNYGDFVEPQVTVSELPVAVALKPQSESAFLAVQAEPRTTRPLTRLGDWQGRWLMVRVGPSACDASCQQELWLMRQIRLTTGRERDRVERVWILTDNGQPEPALLADQQGLWVIRVKSVSGHGTLIDNWLNVALSASGPAGKASNIWVIDPMGNLMMRFPDQPDPNGMKKDMNRLLKASRIG